MSNIYKYLKQTAPRFQQMNLKWNWIYREDVKYVGKRIDLWTCGEPPQNSDYPEDESRYQTNMNLLNQVDQDSDDHETITTFDGIENPMPLLESEKPKSSSSSGSFYSLDNFHYSSDLQELYCGDYPNPFKIHSHCLPTKEVKDVLKSLEPYIVSYHVCWFKQVIEGVLQQIKWAMLISQYVMVWYVEIYQRDALKYILLGESIIVCMLHFLYKNIERKHLLKAQLKLERILREKNRMYQAIGLRWAYDKDMHFISLEDLKYPVKSD